MNLRIPDDLDARLAQLAEAEHTSKSALVLRGVKLVLDEHRRRSAREATLAQVLEQDSDLMERLADA